MKTQDLPLQQVCAKWSNRILILSLLGIAYLTLFPFQSPFVPTFELRRSPFLLGISGKRPSYWDFFLNVLLFVPLGFALCAKVRKRSGSRWISFLLALAVGAGLSYAVEFVQLYIPSRDSGWGDVISNTTGSVAGFFLFELCGGAILEVLSTTENFFRKWLSPRRVAVLLASYFTIWFGVSAILQKETRLSNWDPQCVLIVGNDASGQSPWMGQVLQLQIWNRALPEEAIRRIAARESVEDADPGLLGSYDFASSSSYLDKKNVLPTLDWTPQQPKFVNARPTEFDAKSWLRTKVPVENLTREILRSSQFTVHIVCAPAATQVTNGRIVSLSQSAENVNFHLRQEGDDLVVWIRNPLSERHALLAWRVPRVFEPGKVRDIVASYDGSDAFIYVDGNRAARPYRLSPGASLVHHFLYIQTADLDGYIIVYQTLIFLPAGLLIGLAADKWAGKKLSGLWMFVLGLFLPAVLLEIFLVSLSGRRIWVGNIVLAVVFGLAGVLLSNADRRSKNSSVAS